MSSDPLFQPEQFTELIEMTDENEGQLHSPAHAPPHENQNYSAAHVEQIPAPNHYSEEPMLEEVNEEKRDEIIVAAKKFESEWSSFKEKEFFSQATYFIISTKWLKRWKEYVGFKEVINGLPLNKFFGCGSLPVLNEDIIDPTTKFTIRFEEEYSHFNVKLRDGLIEKIDYQFVDQNIWTLFDQYTRIAVPRCVVETIDGKKVEMYFQQITCLPLYMTLLKDIQHQRLQKFVEVIFQISRYAKVEEVIELVKDKIAGFINGSRSADFSNGRPTRLWKLPDDTRKNILLNTLHLGCKANPSFSYKLYLDAQYMNEDVQIGEFDLMKDSLIVAEMKEFRQNWCFYNAKRPLDGSCSNCKEVKLLTELCSCKYAAYCSKSCKSIDKSHHKFRCPNDGESDEEEHELELSEQSMRGLTGLRNLGNTCFMNSGLQCLSHIAWLSEFFLSGGYINDINKDNPLGTKGQLSTHYAKMIRNLWFGTDSSYSPTQLKKAIGKFQPMFSGYNQHDSGELITYLLDGLHQDLNRVKVKPYVETKDYDGRPDRIIAKEAWDGFTARNQSIIVDLMYGQYKSIVDCPNCQYQSIQFDPFLVCSLPILNTTKKSIEISFVTNHIYAEKLTISYEVSWAWKMSDILNQIRKVMKLSQEKQLICYVASYSTCELVDIDRSADYVRKQYKYRTIFVRELLAGENPAKNIKILLANVTCHSYYSDESYRKNVIPYRLYYVDPQITNKQLHLLIYSYYQSLRPIEHSYEQEIINVQEKEQPFRILMIPSSRYYTCEYCEKNKCDGCQLKFNDQKFRDLIKWKGLDQDNDKKVEIQLYWRKNDKEIEKKLEDAKDMTSENSQGQKKTTKLGTSIYQCFKLFETPQILAEDNAWFCPKCKDFVLAKKQMQIYKAPKILVICLKRFKRKEYTQQKLNILVDFPIENFDLTNFVLNNDLPHQNQKKDVMDGEMEIEIQKGKIKYDLIGISNHFGSTGGGHYTAYCKDPTSGNWFDFDDSSVSKLRSKEDVVSESAYILFYQRRAEQTA